MLEREEAFSKTENPRPQAHVRDGETEPNRVRPVRQEVMAHYRTSLEENRLLAELLAQ